MTLEYSRDLIASVYDSYGDAEWERHDASPAARVAFRIHLHYLHDNIRAGDKVLDIGAGAGRFTVEIAKLGATITVADISSEQLRLNAEHVADAGYATLVTDRLVADVRDLSAFADGSFDAVVCYGGPLSYVVGHTDEAMAELVRVTRPGGRLLLSVMSKFGTLRAFAPGVASEIEEFGLDETREIFTTGDLPIHHSGIGPMHLFHWAELGPLIQRNGGGILVASTTNFISMADPKTCEAWAGDPEMFEVLVGWELVACAQPGLIDGGTHILVVAERT